MKTLTCIGLLSLAFLVGCATDKNTYYWGDYSETLYDFKKNPDEKTAKAHKDQLLLIITESPKKEKRVPPGVYAEYGYLLVKDGKETDGMEMFDKELTLYPESAVFIQRIKAELTRGKK
jgi:hypothetical protein